MISRRALIASAAGAAAAVRLLPGKSLSAGVPAQLVELAPAIDGGTLRFDVRAGLSSLPLLGPDAPRSDVWVYADRLFPVIRVPRGAALSVNFRNDLPGEHSTIHWHGIRLANAMDGVPGITQKPVRQGETFTYAFTPPDAGTFFFHPHCNEAAQAGQGLAGILIVDGDAPDRFDGDIILAAKDWRLNPDGGFSAFTTVKGASRAGTFGAVRSVNGVPRVVRPVPAVADLRVRLLNLDSTRIMEIGLEGAEAFVIAIDGNAVAPFALDTWRMGPAMRLDIALRTPAAGGTVQIHDYGAAGIHTLAVLESEGAPKRSGDFMPAALLASAIPEPDTAGAEGQAYVFGAASDSIASFIETLPPDDPLAAVILDALCTGSDTFWSINKLSWPKDGHDRVPPPLARLVAGRTYRFTLQNATPHSHPIHLHGHAFKVLGSTRRPLPAHFADTVLIAPKERIDIAFVARQGDWMFHCHILEHLETGMMGYLRIT